VTAPLGRALRVIAPSDFRLIWRDGFLLFVLVVLPLACWGLRWLLPYASGLVSEWVDLERYYGLILAYLLGQQPVVMGWVVGILFVEEREEGTLLALQTTPLSLPRFLGYRLLAGMALATVLTAIGISLAGLVTIPVPALFAAAALASFAVPLVALGYATFLDNKLQAVASGKLVQGWAGVPGLLYFAPGPWPWLASIVFPMYYPMRLFWSAANGAPEWWLILPGVGLPAAAVAWLWRRLQRVLHT
jgi:fluoroquinolone transport system permease protein